MIEGPDMISVTGSGHIVFTGRILLYRNHVLVLQMPESLKLVAPLIDYIKYKNRVRVLVDPIIDEELVRNDLTYSH